MSKNRPTAGTVEERTAALEVADRRIRGLIPYNTPSRDLGGWTEVVEPTAFRSTDISELRCVVDHAGVPLARHPRTLSVEDSPEGLRWSADPPKSRQDVVEAIERGDMRAGSWRMVVGRDEWRGDVRHIHEISQLRDVAIVGAEEPAYGDAATVEYRTTAASQRQEEQMSESTTSEERTEEERAEDHSEDESQKTEAEQRTEQSTATLRVEDRAQGTPRSLADAFRSRGWPAERATLGYDEYRATVEYRTLTVSGSVNTVNQAEQQSAALGWDARYAYPAFQQVPVGRDVTSVHLLQQSGRSLASATSVLRAIDATTQKPETSSTVNEVTVPLKQVASIESGVPNVMLEQPAFRTVIEQDLRHALDGGLDKLIIDAIAASGFSAPGSDPLPTSVRKAITVVQAAGYNPNVLILTPTAAEALDTLVSGVSGGSADYVFAPAQFAPQTIFGLQVRISKTIPAPAVVDSTAFGKLYVSPITLSNHEEDAGATNKSTVRLEGHAAFGTERQAAACRIAAS